MKNKKIKLEDVKINFFTWNSLTRAYFVHSSFKDSDPLDFDLEKRDNFIINKLEKLMNGNYVISLQEVDLTTWNKLVPLFEKCDYYVNWTPSGTSRDDFMGVLLGWPRKKYKLVDYYQCIPPIQAKESEPKEVESNKETLYTSPWGIVSRKWNWLLMAKLEEICSQKIIVFAAYYAPLFTSSFDATFISTDLLFSNLEKFSGDLPIIIGGDFNFPLNSDSFNLVTTDEKKEKEIILLEKSYLYSPKTKLVYKSAYKESFGSEPKFTNRVQRTFKFMDTDTFEDTLDFIFFTNFTPKLVESEKLNEELLWYPNSNNPSDHLSLQTTFYL